MLYFYLQLVFLPGYQKKNKMIDAKDYKYVKPTTNEIVFAIVVKKPHWIDRPNQICKDLPVGAITWMHKSYIHDLS